MQILFIVNLFGKTYKTKDSTLNLLYSYNLSFKMYFVSKCHTFYTSEFEIIMMGWLRNTVVVNNICRSKEPAGYPLFLCFHFIYLKQLEIGSTQENRVALISYVPL